MDILARALAQLPGKPDHPIQIIGTRHGEKKHKTLLSREERSHADDLKGYFRVRPDLRDLNYGKYVEQGEKRISEAEDYTSANTHRLDVEGMKQLLMKLDFIRDLVAGRPCRWIETRILVTDAAGAIGQAWACREFLPRFLSVNTMYGC